MKYILQNRIEYYSNTTIGELTIEGNKFCFTLEDTCRPYGIKVDNETAIPENTDTGYNVITRYSPGFDREVLVLCTNEEDYTLTYGGVSFQYVYAHGGNKHEDSKGCILVANNRDGNNIYDTAEHDLFDKVKAWLDTGEEVRWVIHNAKQEG